MLVDLNCVVEFLRDNDNYCILCHKNLDGDTLGGAYALFYGLLEIGKRSKVQVMGQEHMKKFDFLIPKESYELDFAIDNFITVDVADLLLLDENFRDKTFSLCIDHHDLNKIPARLRFIDSYRAATCELIYLILKELGVNLNKNILNCLYTGICTDTGCFKFSNVTPLTHKIAAELIEKGADFSNINFYMFDNKTKARLQLEKEIISNLEYYFNGRCVLVFVTQHIIDSVNATKEDCLDIAYIPACLQGVFVAITAKQEQECCYKISVRARNGYNANAFCRRFGGGGHNAAAGCTIYGSLVLVREKLICALREEFLL